MRDSRDSRRDSNPGFRADLDVWHSPSPAEVDELVRSMADDPAFLRLALGEYLRSWISPPDRRDAAAERIAERIAERHRSEVRT